MRVLVLLIVVGCSDGAKVPVPNIAAPTCGWIEHEVYAAPDESCVRLTPSEGNDLRFLSEGDDSCNGVACLILQPGERAVVIGPILGSDDIHIRYSKTIGDCDDLEPCPGE